MKLKDVPKSKLDKLQDELNKAFAFTELRLKE